MNYLNKQESDFIRLLSALNSAACHVFLHLPVYTSFVFPLPFVFTVINSTINLKCPLTTKSRLTEETLQPMFAIHSAHTVLYPRSLFGFKLHS